MPRPQCSHGGPTTWTDHISHDRLRPNVTGAFPEMLLASDDLAGFLHGVTTLTLAAVRGAEGAVMGGLSLLRERRSPTVAFIPARARALDETAGRFPGGPTATALQERVTVRMGDVRQDRRWPDFRAAAETLGVRAVLAVPFDLAGDARAAISLYSPEAHDFDVDMVRAVEAHVHHASSALRLAVRMARHRDLERDLRAAMASRTIIDLAVGIIMGQNRCSQDEAVEILKAASNHRNLRLGEVAADVVEAVSRQTPQIHFES